MTFKEEKSRKKRILKRGGKYAETLPFFEFRLYRNSQLINQVLIARLVIAYKVKAVPPAEKEKEFYNLLEQFFSFSLPESHTAESLAGELRLNHYKTLKEFGRLEICLYNR